VSAVSTHSIGPPRTVPGVVAVASPTLGVKNPGVNNPIVDSTDPSDLITAETPLVAEISTSRPCSTARTRLIACC